MADEFDDEFDDLSLALDDDVLQQIAQIESSEGLYDERSVASSSKLPLNRIPPSEYTNTRNAGISSGLPPTQAAVTRQMTLFGKPAAQSPPRPAKIVTPSPGLLSIMSQGVTQPGSSRAALKQWDRGAFLARERAEMHNKARKEPLDFDPNDPPGDLFVGSRRDFDLKQKRKFVLPPPPTTRELPELPPRILQLDREAAQTWVYPTNMQRRDYQYNIVQKALFNNVLVALPTGLGKTFIAAVVILNFFRWYPDGKILFLAPSRPLVDQQKIACHGICGLPWDCAVDLTGSTAKGKRRGLWQSKRIFYMTPQTLENDIRNESCDPREVVCVVVDEAHRAKGKYAYVNCIARLMEVNTFFRVLALSATPGKDSDSVQEVVDKLHINKIELRTEEAIDVKPYVFRKREEIVNVPLGKDLNVVKNNWCKLMRTKMDPLVKAGLLRDQDPSRLHYYAVSSIHGDMSKKAMLAAKPFLQGSIKELSDMARALQHLQEHSVTMFYEMIRDRASGTNAKGKKSASKSQIYTHANTTFRDVMKDLEEMQDYKGRIVHPKMEALKTVLMQHFDQDTILRLQNAEAIEESGRDVFGGTPQNSSQSGTRAMVFASYRKCCNEIVQYLHDCGLKATVFVGQSKDKEGNAGMTQKQQEAIITEFKAGVYDVLVATQIGEEGLDIGSVDVLVCYDSPKDPVRMLQRIGRTGRKRDGKVFVLTSEGRESTNWQHSKDNHRAVQKEVESLRSVTLFDDVERMIPDEILPKADLRKVDQPLFDPSMVDNGKPAKATKAAAKGKQPAKTKKDPKRNMPQGALEGFIVASALEARRDSSSSDSDRDTRDEQPQTHSQRMRRALQVSSDEEDKENLSLNIGVKIGKSTSKSSAKGSRNQTASLSTAFCSTPDSSSDATLGKKNLGVQSRRSLGSAAALATTSGPQVIDDDEFDLSNAVMIDPSMEAALQQAERSGQQDVSDQEQSPSSSPVVMRVHRPHPLIAQIEANENLFVEDIEDDLDEVVDMASPAKSLMGPPDSLPRCTGRRAHNDASSSSPIKAVPQRRSRPVRPPSTTPSPTKKQNTRTLKRSRPLVVEDEDEDDDADGPKRPNPAQSKSKAARDPFKKAHKDKVKRKKQKITNSPTSRALFQWEADRSTDEEVHGERDENDSGIGSSDEDDEDRAAVGDFMPTQAPKGYNQQSIYMQSMLSQAAPSEFRRLNHGPFPGIGGRFGQMPDDILATPRIRRPGVIPSSESRGRTNETDRYSEDSFVVNDDEEIVWDSEPDALPNSSL